jgi:hypothetical protein
VHITGPQKTRNSNLSFGNLDGRKLKKDQFGQKWPEISSENKLNGFVYCVSNPNLQHRSTQTANTILISAKFTSVKLRHA